MDKYDLQIEEIKSSKNISDTIYNQWLHSYGLFKMISPLSCILDGPRPGCLLMISEGYYSVLDKNGNRHEQLTQQIRNDKRIPDSANNITIDNLSVFAEWQRRLDIRSLAMNKPKEIEQKKLTQEQKDQKAFIKRAIISLKSNPYDVYKIFPNLFPEAFDRC